MTKRDWVIAGAVLGVCAVALVVKAVTGWPELGEWFAVLLLTGGGSIAGFIMMLIGGDPDDGGGDEDGSNDLFGGDSGQW